MRGAVAMAKAITLEDVKEISTSSYIKAIETA